MGAGPKLEIVCDNFAGGGGAQVRAAGNSVCSQVAEALVRANVRIRYVEKPEESLTGGLFG